MIAGKNDTAWEKLFTKLHILEQIKDKGTFEISAKQIKEFREPRLMTKFDWKDSLPKLFRDNNLSILPNSRGTYLIGHFKAYQKLQTYDSNIMVAQLPEWVQTFQDFKITSESVALNIAQASGMIDTILKRQDGEPFAISTLTGRLKSGDINYRIQDTLNKKDHHDIHVENSQVEIDAGFENLDHLAVIEAKNRIPMDFLICQLYYPYRLYQNLKTGKDILPIYFTYADQIFSFHIFRFTDSNNYSSIKQIGQYNFILDQALDLNINTVKKISHDSRMLPESTPYPQANNVTRILDTIMYLKSPKTKYELAAAYGYDSRQGDYYGNALKYWGLADKKGNKFVLTRLGKQVSKLPNSNNRNEIIIRQMLAHRTVKLIFDATLKNGGVFDDAYGTKILNSEFPNMSNNTIHRRLGTIKSWINWILDVME